jgi:hypothetical protein
LSTQEQRGSRQTLHNLWGETCKIWWLNPRNQSKYCRRIGEAWLDFIVRLKGKDFSFTDAIRDGFDPKEEYIQTLMITNKLTREEVLEATWYQYVWVPTNIKFETWVQLHVANAKSKNCTTQYCPLCQIESLSKKEE